MAFREGLQKEVNIERKGLNTFFISFDKLSKEYIEKYFTQKKGELLSILDYDEASKLEKEIDINYEEYKEIPNNLLVFGSNAFENVKGENLLIRLLDAKNSIESYLAYEYNIHFKFSDVEFDILENFFLEEINKNGEIDIDTFNEIMREKILYPLYNFLYIYEGKINELTTNPENIIILQKIGETFKLSVSKKTSQEVKEELEEYKQSPLFEKSKRIFGGENNDNTKNYLDIRKNPLENLDKESIPKKTNWREERDNIIKEMGEENYRQIKENVKFLAELKNLERFFKK